MHLIERARVAVNAAALPFLQLPLPISLTGPGSSLALCRSIAAQGITKLLLVCGRVQRAQGVIDALTSLGVQVETFPDIPVDPGYDTVLAGIEKLRQCGADAVLAFGGGSPIDCAKAIIMSHANNKHPSDLVGVWLYAAPRKPCLPFFVIPTTAGTGSEASIGAVISDTQAQSKRTILDPKMVPLMVALDPLLTVNLPGDITVATTIDALTHAVEAYLSTMATTQTDTWAKTATTLIVRNLPIVMKSPENLQAREDLLLASYLAGLAFTRAGLGYVHAFAHQLGGHYHITHGLANAILLPHVLAYSKPKCAARIAALADAAQLGEPDADDDQRAQVFIDFIRHMGAKHGIPDKVQALRREDFHAITRNAFAEAHGTYGVPRYMDELQAHIFLESVMATPAKAKRKPANGGRRPRATTKALRS